MCICKEREQLKKDLKAIRDNGYNLQHNESFEDYVGLMLKYIGDADPKLRDDLIYMTFATWIYEKHYFSEKQLADLLEKLLSEDFAFYNIGSENDDSVLRRSFSMLLIDPILSINSLKNNFLDETLIIKTKDALIKYFKEEKDLRGYDKEKGWMHGLAHTSDGIRALLNCKYSTEEICKEVLDAIEYRVCEGKEVFSNGEDERIINIVYYDIIQDKLLSEEYICKWIEGLSRVLNIEDSRKRFIGRTNVKNLIRSLYFRFIHIENNEKFTRTIIELERKLNAYIEQ